jgi:hypothetical protein
LNGDPILIRDEIIYVKSLVRSLECKLRVNVRSVFRINQTTSNLDIEALLIRLSVCESYSIGVEIYGRVNRILIVYRDTYVI